MKSIVDRLEKERPSFHDDGKGGLISWNSNTNLLRAIERSLSAGMRTLEIGSGYITVMFLNNKCRHTAISPVQAEADRITAYCNALGISTGDFEFHAGQSYDFLPGLPRESFDLILIDGAHRFPFPLVDWFFCAMLLKKHGLIVIDDTDLMSCQLLLRFMMNDDHWEPLDVRENFGIFQKKGDHNYPLEWQGQFISKEKIARPEDLMNALYGENIFDADNDTLSLSVIICTYNRAELLEMALEGLERQTLGKDKFEVILIDDGSADNTRAVAQSFACRLPLKYFYQKNAGLAAARNHGIYVSKGKILFFADDDDIMSPTLLEEHLKTHRRYPQHNFAVLNYTGWAPGLHVTPLMHFVTEVGCFLFSYPHIKHGDILDYTYFWGGRSSCKRDFLIEHGVFNPVFRFGCEDIELGYRLSKAGLRVVFNKNAVSYMARPVNFEDFCNRLIKQGRSQYVFSTLHNDPAVHRWAELPMAGKWPELEGSFAGMKKAATELDMFVNGELKKGVEIDATIREHLHKAYWWIFKACKIKGIIQAKEDLEGSPRKTLGQGPDAGRQAEQAGVVAPESPDLTLTLPFDQYQRYRMVADIINRFRRGNERFRIIDVGAGAEEYLKKFLPGDDIICLDKEYPESLTRKGNFISGGFTRLSPEENYDFVVSIDCYEHIEPAERELFVNKLIDSSRICTIIAAPFDTEGVSEIEIRANESYRLARGSDYKWLQEHIQNGLPSLDHTLQLVKNRGFEPVTIPNGYLERWFEMMPIYLLAEGRNEFAEILRALSVFYNVNFYSNDNKTPAYRQVLIINKTKGPESPSFDGLVSARPETDEDFEFRKQLLGAYLEQIKCLFRMVESDDRDSFLEELAQRADYVKKLEVKLNEKIAHEATIRDKEGRYLTKWVNFEFCSSCNLRCKWCSLDHTKKRSLMTVEVLARALDELSANPKFDIDRIDLHNAGEVLLHPELEGMLGVIKEKKESFRRKPTVHLLTNATLLDERRTAVITGADVLDEIRFSMDGGNLNNYKEIRRGADWETVKSNVLNFIAKNREKGGRIKTGVICIVPPEMPLKTEWMDDDFRTLFSRIDNVELRHPHNWDGSRDLHLARNIYKTEGRLCKFLLKNLVILPNGDVTVCCADLNSRGVIGNITKNSLEDIYLSGRRMDMLDLYRNGKMEDIDLCKDCAGYYE